MAGRIYVSPVIFEVETDPESGETSEVQYAKIMRVANVFRTRALIATEPTGVTRGRARNPWALCYVDATDWAAVEADPDHYRILTDALDAAPTNPVRNQIRQRGFLTQAEADAAPTQRLLIEAMVQKHYPGVTFARAFPEFA